MRIVQLAAIHQLMILQLARLARLVLIPQVVRVFAVRVRQASILRVLVKQLAPTVLLTSTLLPQA